MYVTAYTGATYMRVDYFVFIFNLVLKPWNRIRKTRSDKLDMKDNTMMHFNRAGQSLFVDAFVCG